jgi:HPt (histidine-containing phosphotransfer) domain-containing protein
VAPSPADGLPPAARAGFEALRQRFLAGLPERWREIEAAPDDRARIAALHRLAGAAGSYGFDELGRTARAAEHLAAGGNGPALAQALANLQRLLRDATADS